MNPQKSFVLFLAVSFLLLSTLTGCGMRATSKLPYSTPASYEIAVSQKIKQMTIAVKPFDVSRTEVSGGHHEGLLQVRQPWIWGPSKAQKAAMFRDLKDVARYGFIDELLRQGLKVRIVEMEQARMDGCDVLISGEVQSIVLNTYGQGTVEGFGSAGNYWESKICFLHVRLFDIKKNRVIWEGDLREYSKLPDCPVKLDWTIFTVVAKSVKTSLAMSGATTTVKQISGAYKAVKGSGADYIMEERSENPVETATRMAALDAIRNLSDYLNSRR